MFNTTSFVSIAFHFNLPMCGSRPPLRYIYILIPRVVPSNLCNPYLVYPLPNMAKILGGTRLTLKAGKGEKIAHLHINSSHSNVDMYFNLNSKIQHNL